MKAKSYVRQLRDERALLLFSYLQALPGNSPFSERLMACTAQAIIDLKHHHTLDWKVLDSILENKSPLEDPQEQLFTHLVGSPLGSFIVYPGTFQFYQYALTRLLNLSGLLRIDSQQLGVVYFLLSLSQTVAERTNAKRYSGGVPDNKEVFIPSRQVLEKGLNKLYFSKADLECVARQYDLSWENMEKLIFKGKSKDLREELAMKGYCDAVTLTPFYPYKDGYILLSPSALLHSAYSSCKQILIERCGKERFTNMYSQYLLNETSCLLQKVPEPFLGKVELDSLSFLLYREDDNNIFCVIPYLAEMQQDIAKCQAFIDSYVRRENIQSNGVSMFLIIYSQIEDDEFPLCTPKNTLAFSIDDFTVIINERNVNLQTLYYYLQDKQTVRTTSYTQEIDLFAYYLSKRESFYLEDVPTFLMIVIGMARDLREKYYIESDVRYIESAMSNRIIPIEHFHDIPSDVPVYAPLYASNEFMFLMVELGNHRLSIKYDKTHQEDYEIVHSVALWFYAVWKVKHLPVLHQHIDVIYKNGDRDSIQQESQDVYLITLDIERLLKNDSKDFEEQVLLHFVKLLQDQGALSDEITDNLVSNMFAEAKGHFMLAGTNGHNPLLDNDGVKDCHYLSDRWTDKILDEIADYINHKGEEKKLTVEESKKVMARVMEYLGNEVKQILSSTNTARMLENCLYLHHAMIYWSRLTNYRYDSISSAYHYIGSEFKNQSKYLNDYSEMNILAQGLIEYIVQYDIHSEGDNLSIDAFDRLFAIMHHIVSLGIYFDLLNEGKTDSEIVLLKNGRLAIPRIIEDINVPYFTTLRKQTMENLDVKVRQYTLLPKYKFDGTDKKLDEAFVAEFGIEKQLLFDIQGRSIDYANRMCQPVVCMSKELFENETLQESLADDKILAFYDHFVLSKDAYSTIPLSERLLQRYNRSVQLSSRPWILYEDKVFFSTKSIYVSCQLLLERLDSGTIKHKSDLMNKYVGKVSDMKGHAFTQNLKAYFNSLKDEKFIVNMEVQICPGKPLAAEENLGDIDVLLIDPRRKKIICIEAKDYYEARTVYDMLSQNRKIEKALPKVVRRDEWCNQHKDLFKFYSKDIDESYDVKTVFLTYEEPTYKYFRHSAESPITMLSAFDIVKDYEVIFQ